jgi:hypothetical protein
MPTATSDDPVSVLVRRMNPNIRDTWETRVFKSDREGLSHSEEPLYRREYSDEDSARRGHAKIVKALRDGQQLGE